MILAFTPGVLVVTAIVSFGLSALGVPHGATWGSLVCAALMIGGGPLLTRRLRTRMLDRAAMGSR
jgi:putative Ca2+/H+ antiporter (TMEM165/GDT1 family)